MNSPATMKTVDLVVEAKSYGIEVTEDVQRNDLIRVVAEKRKELGIAGGDTKPQTEVTNASKSNSGDSKVVYYWIKMQSYIDDRKADSAKLLPVGLYKFNRVLPRLQGAPINAVEKFEGEIPERVLLKIGEAVGIKYHASDDVDYEELLAKLLSVSKFK